MKTRDEQTRRDERGRKKEQPKKNRKVKPTETKRNTNNQVSLVATNSVCLLPLFHGLRRDVGPAADGPNTTPPLTPRSCVIILGLGFFFCFLLFHSSVCCFSIHSIFHRPEMVRPLSTSSWAVLHFVVTRRAHKFHGNTLPSARPQQQPHSLTQ